VLLDFTKKAMFLNDCLNLTVHIYLLGIALAKVMVSKS